MCGDDYAQSAPRPHELGGMFGEGVIVKAYKAGDLIPVHVKLTQDHLGSFSFTICNIDRENESEKCFEKNPVLFENGSSKHPVPNDVKTYNLQVRLPAGLTCDHCVLRWTYTTGNSWGWCDEAHTEGKLGCGEQEQFKSCSDISIK